MKTMKSCNVLAYEWEGNRARGVKFLQFLSLFDLKKI